jgi:hypothetical protein
VEALRATTPEGPRSLTRCSPDPDASSMSEEKPQTHTPRMTCPACGKDPGVGGHCTCCFARLPVDRSLLVACSKCSHLTPLSSAWCSGCTSRRYREPRPSVPFETVEPSAVWRFCSVPVPPGGVPQWEEWRVACGQLGHGAAKTLLDVLRSGDQTQQDGAILCLRVHGFEAWGVGLPAITEYLVRGPDAEEFETIHPAIPPTGPA